MKVVHEFSNKCFWETKWEQSMEQNDEKPCFIFPNDVLFADSDYTQKLHLWII